MSEMPDTSRAGNSRPLPVLSVIIPARNEEHCIGACIQSLISQSVANGDPQAENTLVLTSAAGLSYEIIVVDDGSTDRTPSIAGSFGQVRVVAAGPLPPNWVGKCNACAVGARIAHGSWLLFTDADTVHEPESLERSVAEAQFHGSDLLSYSPRQEVSGLLQHALMPVIFAELASRYRPRYVCDPVSPVAAANGQYLLITRNAYDAVGGHASVARDLLEDVAIARAVKRSGRRIRFRHGGDAVRTRMYRTAKEMFEGWTKNLAILFPSAEKLAFLRAVEFAAILGAALAAMALAWSRATKAGVMFGLVAVLASANFYGRVQKAHFGTLSTIISPLGLPFFSYLLLRSRISHRRGRVAWKGREYKGSAESVEPQTSQKTTVSGAGNG